MDASARVTMKDAAKCDKRREWQNSENQENAERILHLQIISEGMSVSEVVAKGADSKGQSFRVVLPISIHVAAPLEQQNNDNEAATAALLKEATMLAIISQWSGYSQIVSTDAEFLTAMGLEGDDLPHWTKTLGEWLHQEKINLGELVIAIEYMSTII